MMLLWQKRAMDIVVNQSLPRGPACLAESRIPIRKPAHHRVAPATVAGMPGISRRHSLSTALKDPSF